MNVAYFSSGRFGAGLLSSLLRRGIRPGLIFTLPDRPQGRGMKPRPLPVKSLAQAEGIPVVELPLSREELASRLRENDLILSCDVGFIFPDWMVEAYPCYNLHPSLLPNWRGPAPIFWAIRKGEEETGITLFRMDKEIDAGKIALQERVKIEPDWDYGQLESVLIERGADVVQKFLREYPEVDLKEQEGEVTYARKVKKEDFKIDWSEDSRSIYNLVRASSPYWGAWASFAGKRMKVFSGRPVEGVNLEPGEIKVDEGNLIIGCGQGGIEVLEVQLEGKKRMGIKEFLAGYKNQLIKIGRME